MKYCSKCGNEMKNNEKSCPSCGNKTKNKWWVWVLVIAVLVAVGGISDSLEKKSIVSNTLNDEYGKSFYPQNSNEITLSIDHNLVGVWINQKSTYILEKLVLLADGTGYFDSSTISWGVEDNKIIFKFPNKTVDYGYRLENSKLYMDNGCQLIKIDDKQTIKISSLLNTKWIPDFVHYPNNYHVDNPALILNYVSDDEKTLIFKDELGVSYKATTNNGKRYTFDDDKMFYAFSIRGLDPEEGYDEPTIFVDVTNGGWYTVTYKPE